jgi:RNA-directed DNA polymerase
MADPNQDKGILKVVQRIVGRLLGANKPTTTSASASASQNALASQSKPSTPTQSTPEPRTAKSPKAPRTAEGLDASPFLPIARNDLLNEAKSLRFGLFNGWFGRRDLIPPVSDPRTLLVDRAMVAQGLLTPDQLADIHRVGAEMDRLRPQLIHLTHQASLAGAAAVLQDREERQRLKEQKKAEAKARQETRRKEIEHRKENDILFLGRGVSSRLGDRDSDVVKLTSQGLPVISTPFELAAKLGLTVPQLRWLAFHNEAANRVHYIHFEVKKKSGGTRHLSAPHRTLSKCQRWILREILNLLSVDSAAHGFARKRSIVSNAKNHVGRDTVLNMDLESFFPSIEFPRVRSLFQRIGYSPAVATILALLCTESPRQKVQWNGAPFWIALGPRALPQGACTSPAISNQIAKRLDRRLTGLSTKFGFQYSRYADDLTFSGDQTLDQRAGYVMAKIRHIAEQEGFAVNHKKTRVLGRNAAQTVTGLVVNDKLSVSRHEIRRIRAILHRARTEGLEKQNRAGHPHFRAWLRGMIEFIKSVRPDLGRKLLAELEGIP